MWASKLNLSQGGFHAWGDIPFNYREQLLKTSSPCPFFPSDMDRNHLMLEKEIQLTAVMKNF